MNWLSEIDKLVDRKPEWHTRLMNGISSGLVEHALLVDDICEELGVYFKPEISDAVDHYQRKAEDDLWNDAYPLTPIN